MVNLIPWLARSYSEGFSAEIAERYLVYASTLDASPFLPRVTVPTLVMHRQSGRLPPPVALSRDFAAMIPNARLLAVEGRGIVPWVEMPPITNGDFDTGPIRERLAQELPGAEFNERGYLDPIVLSGRTAFVLNDAGQV